MGLFKFGKNKEGDPHSSSPAVSGNSDADRAQQEILIEEKQDMIKGIEDLSPSVWCGSTVDFILSLKPESLHLSSGLF